MSVTDIQGYARQVPPAGDEVEWTRFRAWLSHLVPADQDAATGRATISPHGHAVLVADPGDWIVRSQAGLYYVTREAA